MEMIRAFLNKCHPEGSGATKDLRIETAAESIGGIIHLEDPFDSAAVLFFQRIGRRSG